MYYLVYVFCVTCKENQKKMELNEKTSSSVLKFKSKKGIEWKNIKFSLRILGFALVNQKSGIQCKSVFVEDFGGDKEKVKRSTLELPSST